jgi:hypothetical protein
MGLRVAWKGERCEGEVAGGRGEEALPASSSLPHAIVLLQVFVMALDHLADALRRRRILAYDPRVTITAF